MEKRNQLYLFLFLSIALIFCPDGRLQAEASTAPPFFIAALEPPNRPIPPTPPSVSGLKKETTPPAKEESPKKTIPSQPITEKQAKQSSNDDKKTPATKVERQETAPAPTANNDSQTNLLTDTTNDTPEAKDDKTHLTKDSGKTSTSLFAESANKPLYGVFIIGLLGLTAYFYFTTPPTAQRPKPAARKPPTNGSVPENKRIVKKQPADVSLLTAMPKIRNSSLLEQLIKYDMENYGELRSNLDYEQPAYVEKLIRKYGGNDQVKINRAINLFYNSRRDK